MTSRAYSSGVRLNEQDAAVVKGMLNRGDRQHDIAAWFCVNGGRIAEIATGYKFGWVKAASTNLPPAGPYLTVREGLETRSALDIAQEALRKAEEEIERLRREAA